ncbi:hypothetical protein [Nonomuraea endophytica]|uniref:Uncharacterized protein n=1 Tax=Nonomuraea endophytica TaxID=714136 RepID=A0A7W8EK48_9ACTN|nr:hypothetical protein [Nonomuraea endophytica]MBB5081342.1 hypothetical protein [Nonomuraea endophytica]
MSARLMGEVAGWLGTAAAEGLTAAERLVLLIVAERANEHSRRMWTHRGDRRDDGTRITLTELIADRAGLTPRGLNDALQRLARRGLEVRVQIATDTRGRPVFARKGHAVDYELPFLPASVELPPRPVDSGSSGPPERDR